MGPMLDGNSAALARYEREQARDGELWDAYGDDVLNDIADDLLDGQKVHGYSLHDSIMDYLTPDDLMSIFMGKPDALDNAKKKLRERLIDFFTEHEPEYVWDRINDREEA